MDDLLLVLAVLPALELMIYVYRKDRVEREPLGLLLLLCLGGCISVVPTMICELMAESVLLSAFGDTLSFIVADNFLGVALIEEGWKLVFLILIAWSSRHFTHFFDGIVYAVFVSLGFALVENIFYVGGEETIGDAIALAGSRGLLSVPLHAFCGVFMGFFFSRAKAASLKGSHAAFDGARFLTLSVSYVKTRKRTTPCPQHPCSRRARNPAGGKCHSTPLPSFYCANVNQSRSYCPNEKITGILCLLHL